jgi:antitoxin component YwqK of YwqJK toxin-antitoxin module
LCTISICTLAQSDSLWLEADEFSASADAMPDPAAPMEQYDPLNAALGGDSVRQCNGFACSGWVEDHYPNGQLKHRGYYKDGQLVVFKNYLETGQLEREFEVVNNLRCMLRTYHDNGSVRTETKYTKGVALAYVLYYPNGQVRYTEEKHPKEPYYLVMDLFAQDGKPISELHLVDKKKVVFEQSEYWPGGVLKYRGKSQFNPQRFDTQRIGQWTRFDRAGKAVAQDNYVDGKVHGTVLLADGVMPKP